MEVWDGELLSIETDIGDVRGADSHAQPLLSGRKAVAQEDDEPSLRLAIVDQCRDVLRKTQTNPPNGSNFCNSLAAARGTILLLSKIFPELLANNVANIPLAAINAAKLTSLASGILTENFKESFALQGKGNRAINTLPDEDVGLNIG